MYAFASWEEESNLMRKAIDKHHEQEASEIGLAVSDTMKRLPQQPKRIYGIPGLDESEPYMRKNALYQPAYKALATNAFASKKFSRMHAEKW